MKHAFTHIAARTLLFIGLSFGMASTAYAGPEDWESPESIVHALYETISGDAGAKRDWDRYRDLFLEGARMSVAIDSSVLEAASWAWTTKN